jgi:magnesium transporter
MDAFASIISNNLNMIMKFLAAMTIVLSLPTMIASFYGMNVKLPLMQHELAFVIVAAISVMTSLFVSYLFIKKNWF